MKKALNRLGYYYPYEESGITKIADKPLFEAIKKIQADLSLPATGIIKPNDATLQKLNQMNSAKPKGKYIWRTVQDEKTRPGHAALNYKVRNWDDSPDPGEEHNCRCWAEPYDESLYKDAISPTIGPFDLTAGTVILRGGFLLSLEIAGIISRLLRYSPKLTPKQIENLARFIRKIPSNAKNSVQITRLPNGKIKFTATSNGRAPGSKAVYEKTIDSKGRTVEYKKTTYDKDGKILHTKDKMPKGIKK